MHSVHPESTKSVDESDEEDDDWSGLSEDEDSVEIVDHAITNDIDYDEQTQEAKAFMARIQDLANQQQNTN